MKVPIARARGLLAEAGSAAGLHKLADEELMTLVQTGNADAFEVIYDRHCDAAFSLAYRICGRRATAEDVLQEAFIALWRTGARYDRARGSVRNWILRIVTTARSMRCAAGACASAISSTTRAPSSEWRVKRTPRSRSSTGSGRRR